MLLHDTVCQAINFQFPERFFVASNNGHAREDVGEIGVPVPFEGGKQFVADAVAVKGEIAIRGILTPNVAFGAEPCFDFRAGEIEQRPDEAIFGNGVDASESGESGAAQKPVEDRFGLVGEGMTEGDAMHFASGQLFTKEAVAGLAGGLFEVLAGFPRDAADRGVGGIAGNTVGSGEVLDKDAILVGFPAPKLVVKVQHPQRDTEAGGHFAEEVKQRHGIGAARDGDPGNLPGGKHAIMVGGFGDALAQSDSALFIVSPSAAISCQRDPRECNAAPRHGAYTSNEPVF